MWMHLEGLAPFEGIRHLQALGLPGHVAERIAQLSEGNALYLTYAADAYLKSRILPEPPGQPGGLERVIDQVVSRAEPQAKLGWLVLGSLASQTNGSTSEQLAERLGMPLTLVERVIGQLAPLLVDDGAGRHRLYHQWLVDFVLSRTSRGD